MKAILLAPTPPPAGGIAGWTERMMYAKLKDGWEVVVVDEKVSGSRQVFGKAGKKNFREEVKRCFRIWRDLKERLKDPEVKVVHSCIPSMTPSMLRESICASITHLRGRKFITHFRCTVPNTTKGRLGLFVLKRLCKKSDMILSLNEQTSTFLRAITDTPIQLIPNFISESELVDTKSIHEELKTILYVGGIVEDKGLSNCLSVAKEFPEIDFRFVGKGDSGYEARARNEGLNNVVFVGGKDRSGVREELANADVFLFLSYFRGEGFSNALCEAMAAGLPCIVTDWAANADMIGSDGGHVVPVKDVDAVCRSISKMKDPDLRRSMSASNMDKVKKHYIESVVIDQYVDVYNSLSNKPR